MLQYFPLLATLTTRSAGCLAADRRRHLQATSLLFLLQLSSRDGEMSGGSFAACATQPISFYEVTVRYLFSNMGSRRHCVGLARRSRSSNPTTQVLRAFRSDLLYTLGHFHVNGCVLDDSQLELMRLLIVKFLMLRVRPRTRGIATVKTRVAASSNNH